MTGWSSEPWSGAPWAGGADTTPPAPVPAMPQVQIEVAFEEGPFATPTVWTPIGHHVEAFTINRGRTSELEAFPTGTCTLTIDDTDREFDTDNPTSTYAGKLLFNRRVRIRALWDDEWFALFDGYVEAWPAPMDRTRDYVTADVVASDLTRLLSQSRIEAARAWTLEHPVLGVIDDDDVLLGGYPVPFEEERTGQRIERILVLLGVPKELRDIDRGNTVVVADAPTDRAWEYLQRLERSEAGRLFISTDGKITFRERRSWTRRASESTSQATFSDNPGSGGLPYVDAVFDPGSPGRVKNVIVRGAQGREANAIDTTSLTTFGPLEDAQTDLLTADLEELRDHAAYRLGRMKDALPQCVQFQVSSDNDPAGLFPQILGREIGDRVTVERTPTAGTTVPADYWIEGISHTVSRFGQWQTTWTLSAVDDTQYWTIGDDVLGVLDDDDVVLAW